MNDLYSTQLQILSLEDYSEFYLEQNLERFVKSDCIEYRECGIKAFEILKKHEMVIQAKLAEEDNKLRIERTKDLSDIPDLKHKITSLKRELGDLKRIV